MKTYFSVNKIDKYEPDTQVDFPDEWIQTIYGSGLPPHELKVFENCPVILLRNLNSFKGLCNGTRLLVKRLHKYLLECEFTSGERIGETVLIPKITLTNSKDKKLPFTLYRKQFPLRLCYAMTINKSQGQTLDFVGIDFTQPVFAHGQAYVAFSRAKSWNSIRVAVDPERENRIKNIVHKDVLLDYESDTESDA